MADSVIPSRLSVYDEDFDPSLIPLIVKLDGVEVEHVVAYDIEAGTVLHCPRDEQGGVKFDPVAEEIVTEILCGVVTVERGPPPPTPTRPDWYHETILRD